jgi:hypothetical protein
MRAPESCKKKNERQHRGAEKGGGGMGKAVQEKKTERENEYEIMVREATREKGESKMC